MTDKEKLMQILNVPIFPHADADPLEAVADYLLDNDVRPVAHAHWEPVSQKSNCGYRCSRCKKARISYADYYSTNKRAYCFCCGAKMDEETNG